MTFGGLTALSVLLVAAPAPPRVPTFTTSVEAVYVDVFVTRDGQPVGGLTAGDFELSDNGVRQEVSLVSVEAVPIVAVMVFDVSTSVAGAHLDDLRSAGRALIAALRPQDQPALVTFSHELQIAVPLGGDPSTVRRAVDRLEAGGHTALWDGLYAGLKLPVAGGRPMVIVFTDGRDDLSWLSQEQVLKVARESEAIVHVVAITPQLEEVVKGASIMRPERELVEPADIRQVREIAQATGGRLWYAGASAQLEPTFLRILAEMQSRYLLSFTPSGVPRAGWHRLSVKVKSRKGTVRSRTGYFVAPDARPAPAR
ncbi:MAG TPA: VWA domain-containing protein [Vicinamibacteria bacterium]|nr:VWA domain-containing protein [Vicinamibacteria bacterium]